MKSSNGSLVDQKVLYFFLPNLKQKMYNALAESTQSDEYFECLSKFDFIFDTNLGHESGNLVGS
jgi:hypothetical protein